MRWTAETKAERDAVEGESDWNINCCLEKAVSPPVRSKLSCDVTMFREYGVVVSAV